MSNNPMLTEILSDLASGQIDAAEAARRIDALPPEQTAPEGAEPDTEAVDAELVETEFTPEGAAPFLQGPRDAVRKVLRSDSKRGDGTTGVERLKVRGVGRRTRIVGDRSVATVTVEGPHVLRRNGSVLEVTSDGEIGPSFDGFSIVRPPHTAEDFRTLGLGKELVIRANPELLVDAEVTGGTLKIAKMPHLAKIRLSAGSLRCRDVVRIEDALIQAGGATIEGKISSGKSRIRVESGSVTVRLDPASDVTIRADAQLGKVSWPDEQGDQFDEYLVGEGKARLDIAVVMGHAAIRVSTPEEESDEQW